MESMDQHGDGELSWIDAIRSEERDKQMSEQRFSMSIMIMVWRTGMERNITQRDDASCSCMNMSQKLVRFTYAGIIASSLFRVDVPSSC